MERKNEENIVIFEAKIANNLPFERFVVILFMSKVGNHMAVNGYKICFSIEQTFPQLFCIRPLWNEYIPLYMDCVIQYV